MFNISLGFVQKSLRFKSDSNIRPAISIAISGTMLHRSTIFLLYSPFIPICAIKRSRPVGNHPPSYRQRECFVGAKNLQKSSIVRSCQRPRGSPYHAGRFQTDRLSRFDNRHKAALRIVRRGSIGIIESYL